MATCQRASAPIEPPVIAPRAPPAAAAPAVVTADPAIARPGIIHELQALHVKQRRAAANFINLTRKLAREGTISDTIEVGIASDDAEARSLGWPCVGAQRMSIALAAARIKDFRIVIVPRGTTPATAAAADANDAALRSED